MRQKTYVLSLTVMYLPGCFFTGTLLLSAYDVIEILKTVRHKQKEDKLASGKGYDPRGFVCAWEDGRPFEPDWVSKEWRRIIIDDKKRAKEEERAPYIPDGIRFHDLRHTHATILLSQGVSLKVVQERLGHESITTTVTKVHLVRYLYSPPSI